MLLYREHLYRGYHKIEEFNDSINIKTIFRLIIIQNKLANYNKYVSKIYICNVYYQIIIDPDDLIYSNFDQEIINQNDWYLNINFAKLSESFKLLKDKYNIYIAKKTSWQNIDYIRI